MLHNPVKYPKPFEYRPERWLEPDWPTYQEPLTQYPTVVGMTSFGWGQRTCLGQIVTRDETLVACGGLLWGFNLGKKQSADGEHISIEGSLHPIADTNVRSMDRTKHDQVEFSSDNQT